MALQHIRSGTADKRPVASSLADGQIAINYQADSPGAFFKDSAGNLVKVGPIHVGPTAPNATPAGSSGNSLGEGWLDNSGVDAILKVWDGTAWISAKAPVSGNIEVTSINNGPLAGFRNAIINGNFDIWQRGITQTISGYGSADRWYSAANGSTLNTTRQSFTLGQTAVPGEPRYFYRSVVTSLAGAGNYALTSQRIEGVRTFAGQQVTASFWAKADASRPMSFELVQRMGTGGSPSADVPQIGVTKVSLTTSWQKFTVTTTLPSLSGKTLGTDENDVVILRLWFDAGSDRNANTDSLGQQSGTFDIAQIQLEAGPVATPFERRPIGTEFELCQRYYQIQSCYGRSYSAALIQVRCDKVQLIPNMRTTPTVTLTNVGYLNASNLTADSITAKSVGLVHTQTAGNAYSSAFVNCDAEL